jgi:hypothetical protein
MTKGKHQMKYIKQNNQKKQMKLNHHPIIINVQYPYSKKKINPGSESSLVVQEPVYNGRYSGF